MVRNRSHNIIAGFLLVALFTSNLFAIPAFTESIVSSSADGVWGHHVEDVDGDGVGAGTAQDFCNANVPDGWVLNDDDVDDDCSSNYLDCNGTCGGNGFVDCNGNCTTEVDCAGECACYEDCNVACGG